MSDSIVDLFSVLRAPMETSKMSSANLQEKPKRPKGGFNRSDEQVSTAMPVKSYLAIARPDHWFKNVFMLPGAALALVLSDESAIESLVTLAFAVVGTCLVVSANYTINEWLDADSDRHHPVKKSRPAATGKLSAKYVYLQWFALSTVGLVIALQISMTFAMVTVVLLLMGVAYNFPPIRTKDKPYLDVLSEAANNPLRFMLGWFAVVSNVLPPSSILIAYWMGGAYLMAVKRYAEYRFIGDSARIV